MSEVDYADVQGLLRFGYGQMTCTSYALLRVKNVAAAQAWLRAAPVTSAVAVESKEMRPKTALNVAFTAPGLRALGVLESVIEGFSHEFRGGMAQESRARQLGDVGDNAPHNWKWGSFGREPHVVAMFFAEPGHFDSFVRSCTEGSWQEAFEEPYWLKTENLNGVEHFGFHDGISQPQIDWEQRNKSTAAQTDYVNIGALGEFLLGYPNEYGKITDRPLVDADAASVVLLPAQDEPSKKDVGRNGTYLVMRQLEQDVRKFWQFIYQKADGDSKKAGKLGAKMVGRTQAGDPLVGMQKQTIPGVTGNAQQLAQNQFSFDQDITGSRCPFGAHIRRVNPRNTDFPEKPTGLLSKLVTMLGFGPNGFRDDLMSSVKFHRIVRRGREYGPQLLPEAALAPPATNEPERGLYFLCLNANISRQFEFLQNAWIMNSKFSGLTEESDPLLGNRESILGCPVTSNFTIPAENGMRGRLSEVPQFITVRGGAYFFLPSLRALRYFAGVGAL